MKIEGRHELNASRELVWRAVTDPEVLADTIPGCDGLVEVGENEFECPIRVQVGPVQGKFDGKFQLEDLDPPNGYRLKLEGRGPAGFVSGEGEIRLEDLGNSTALSYLIEAQAGGRLAALGQRLMESSARVLARQGFKRLEKRINDFEQAND